MVPCSLESSKAIYDYSSCRLSEDIIGSKINWIVKQIPSVIGFTIDQHGICMSHTDFDSFFHQYVYQYIIFMHILPFKKFLVISV